MASAHHTVIDQIYIKMIEPQITASAQSWRWPIRRAAGKTTTAIKSGTALAALIGERVLIVDLDPAVNRIDGLGIDRRSRTNCRPMSADRQAPLRENSVVKEKPTVQVSPAALIASSTMRSVRPRTSNCGSNPPRFSCCAMRIAGLNTNVSPDDPDYTYMYDRLSARRCTSHRQRECVSRLRRVRSRNALLSVFALTDLH